MSTAPSLAAARVLRFVRKFPGNTCDQIAAELGESPAIVSVLLRALRKRGKVFSAGNTRGTKWSPQ